MLNFRFFLRTVVFMIMASQVNHEAQAYVLADVIKGVSDVAMPLLKPVVERESKAIAEAIIAKLSSIDIKSSLCQKGCNAQSCKNDKTLSACKASCQKVLQMYGYEIKVRFSDKYSITNCMRAAVKAGVQTTQGKSNYKSIAIYSQEDLKLLSEFFAYISAAKKVMVSNGGALNIKVTQKDINDAISKGTYDRKLGNQEIARLITEVEANKAYKNAELVLARANAEIEKSIKEGFFGNQ